MDLNRLLELNNSYNDSHNKVVDLLQSILEKGELTEGDYGEIQDNYSKNEDNYNELNKAENAYMKSDFELKLETLQNTKIDLDVDSVLDLLTNGGRNSAMYKDTNGNIVLDAAKIGELNQVKVLVDENNKKIASIVADTEVEQADGSKVKLKVLFSTLDQKVDGITTTVGEVSGVANDANSKATANTQKISQINQTVNGITSTVKQVEGVANTANGKADDALTKASQIAQTVDGIKTTVQNTGAKVDGSIKETYNEFYLSSSNTTTTGGSWAKTAPAPQAGKYIWLRDVYVTNTGEKTYGNPVCITGAKGDKGDQGAQGIQGEKGDPGKDGADGTSVRILGSYNTVAELNAAHPTGNTIGDGYIVEGNLYIWDGAKFKNCGPIKGDKGDPGTNGKTTYLHIKYSNDGKTFTTNNGEDVGAYIGIYVDFNQSDSNTFSAYQWNKVQGPQGLQGLQGEKGAQGVPGKDGSDGTNGKTSYFHIKYSSVENPTTASQMSETPNTYIGTYTDFIQTDSTDPKKYTWYRFQGLQGEKGEKGIPGVGTDGKTSYLHIKYSNDGGKTFTANNGETVGTYIGTCTDFNSNDPTSVGSYTWAKIKGETGAKGDQGTQGTGVKQVQILYFVHTSKTSAPSTTATGWTTSIPAYQTGKYLWQVNKITYTNNSTAFTTPVYLSSWEAENKAETAVSIANQTSEKFEWIVKKGSTASGILLTDKAIEAIANSSIKLKASQITLEGLVTANGNFKILEDGSIEATNGKFTGEINADKGKISSDLEVDGMNVSGNLSADTLDVRKINCPDLSIGLTGDINITVNPGDTNATNIFTNGATFTSLQTCIESIPKNLNGYTVNITVVAQISENISIKGFNGGTLYIKFNENNRGYIFGHNCSAELLLQGEGTTTQTLVSNYKTTGNVNMRVSGNKNANLVQTVPPGAVLLLTNIDSNGWGYTTYNGKSGWMSTNTSYMVKDEVYQTTGTSTAIQPGELLTQDGKYYAVVFRNCSYAAIFDLEVYGKTGNELNYAIGSIRGSYVDLEDVKVSGSENGIAAERGGRVFQSNTTGKVNGIAQNANHSGTIYIQDGTTINGTMSKDNSSQIIYSSSGVTQDSSSDVGTNDNTTTATSSVTIYSTGGNSYRHNVYTGWKNDNTVRQGDYGYGDCDGIWLFGTQFASKLKGKNITKITLTVTRQQGGVYGAVTCTLKMHNHSSQPGGAPTYVSGWSKTFSLAVNNTTTIIITDSAVLTDIKNGTCQGFGLQGAYDSSHYAVFSGNCTLTATIH